MDGIERDSRKIKEEKLKEVSGGVNENFGDYIKEIMERELEVIPDISNPHSKKEKGKLFKK